MKIELNIYSSIFHKSLMNLRKFKKPWMVDSMYTYMVQLMYIWLLIIVNTINIFR